LWFIISISDRSCWREGWTPRKVRRNYRSDTA